MKCSNCSNKKTGLIKNEDKIICLDCFIIFDKKNKKHKIINNYRKCYCGIIFSSPEKLYKHSIKCGSRIRMNNLYNYYRIIYINLYLCIQRYYERNNKNNSYNYLYIKIFEYLYPEKDLLFIKILRELIIKKKISQKFNLKNNEKEIYEYININYHKYYDEIKIKNNKSFYQLNIKNNDKRPLYYTNKINKLEIDYCFECNNGCTDRHRELYKCIYCKYKIKCVKKYKEHEKECYLENRIQDIRLLFTPLNYI